MDALRRLLLMIGISCCVTVPVLSQTDSSNFQHFDLSNDIQVFAGHYNVGFDISHHLLGHSSFRYVGNTSAYAGIFLDYKWLSLMISLGIPGTNVEPHTPDVKSTQLQAFHFWEKCGTDINFTRLNGLLIKERHKKSIRLIDSSINYVDVSWNLYFFGNQKRYSFRSANYCSLLQRRSGGSVVYVVNPEWQQFRSASNSIGPPTDSLSKSFVNRNPSWLQLCLDAGYTYNFIWDQGAWSINPMILASAGVASGISRRTKVSNVAGWQARLNASYNGKIYFFSINSIYHATETAFPQHLIHSHNLDLSLTAGIRFGSTPGKILGIL